MPLLCVHLRSALAMNFRLFVPLNGYRYTYNLYQFVERLPQHHLAQGLPWWRALSSSTPKPWRVLNTICAWMHVMTPSRRVQHICSARGANDTASHSGTAPTHALLSHQGLNDHLTTLQGQIFRSMMSLSGRCMSARSAYMRLNLALSPCSWRSYANCETVILENWLFHF